MGEVTPIQPSRYGRAPDFEAVKVRQQRKTSTRTFQRPNRRQGFARITEDMFLPLSKHRGPAVMLVVVLVQRSNLRLTRSNGGWTQLPAIVLEQVGLSDRRRRAEAVKALVAQDVLETRTTGKGKALEYRLQPVTRWCGAAAEVAGDG
jgi:hypothetical protein